MGGLLDQVGIPDVVPTDPTNLVAIVGPLVAHSFQGRQCPSDLAHLLKCVHSTHRVSCPADLAHLLKCGHIQAETLVAPGTKSTMI